MFGRKINFQKRPMVPDKISTKKFLEKKKKKKAKTPVLSTKKNNNNKKKNVYPNDVERK